MTKYRINGEVFDGIEEAEDYAVEHDLITDEDVAAKLSKQFTSCYLVLMAGTDYDHFVELWGDIWWDIFASKVEEIEEDEGS